MAKSAWTSDWKVGIRVWVECAGKAMLGEGRAELLSAIDREHSITKAAKSIGVSYRRAWTMVQEVNAAAGDTLVEAAVGGTMGGGARLTPHGRFAVEVYKQVRDSLVETAASTLRRTVGTDQRDATRIHLAAAISLQEAVGQILAEYVLRAPTVRVRAIFGASNELADHLVAGAPSDILISAEPRELDRLEAERLLAHRSRRVIAKNGLAVVGIRGEAPIKKPADLLAQRFKHVAVAEPACPLGRYAKKYLETARVYDELQPKILLVDNSRAVLAAVVSGAAEAGVAFSSDAAGGGKWQTLLRVPTKQVATNYEAAIIDRGKPRKEVAALCEFLSSPTAQRCYRRCGMRPAKE